MKQLLEQYRWKALALLAVFVSVYIIFAVVIPGFSESWSTYRHVQMQEQKIASADNWQQKQQVFQKQEERLSVLYDRLFVSIPKNDQMSAIISLLIEQAEQTQVTIRQVEPRERMARESFTLIPMDLTIRGRFHELLQFMNGLEQANYLVRLTKISMSAPKEYGDRELSARLRLSVTVIQNEKESEATRG